MAITRIKKWGNSYGVRISQQQLAESGMRPDEWIEIHSEVGQLTIKPVQKPKYSLHELLAQMTTENRHDEVITGEATGSEIW